MAHHVFYSVLAAILIGVAIALYFFYDREGTASRMLPYELMLDFSGRRE